MYVLQLDKFANGISNKHTNLILPHLRPIHLIGIRPMMFGLAKKKQLPMAKVEPKIKPEGMLTPLFPSIFVESRDDVTTDKPVASPFCTLSVYFMTDATSSPPNAKIEIFQTADKSIQHDSDSTKHIFFSYQSHLDPKKGCKIIEEGSLVLVSIV